MSIRLVCGYRRTGKDTLYRIFNGLSGMPSNMSGGTNSNEYKWRIFKNPAVKTPFVVENVVRVSFADALKKEVVTLLKLPSSFDTELYKDQPLGDGLTFRDHCIAVAADRRDEDPDYWVKTAFKGPVASQPTMVTDWRYPNEYTWLKKQNLDVVTIRLFRKEVPVPDDTIISEHSLDDIATDFLLVPPNQSEIHLEALFKIMPQYRSYKECSDLCVNDV